MHSIWSRAAQAQGTHRRVCLQTANVLTRGATTGAARRKLAASDVFTACYTSIMATAAVLDAKYKDARRKELDEKIDEARAGLEELRKQSSAWDAEWDAGIPGAESRDVQDSTSAEWRPLPLSEVLASICAPPDALRRNAALENRRGKRIQPFRQELGLAMPGWRTVYSADGAWSSHAVFNDPQAETEAVDHLREKLASKGSAKKYSLEALKKMVKSAIMRASAKSKRDRRTMRTSAFERRVAAEELNPGIPQREPKGDAQMLKAAEAVEDLVDRLLDEAYPRKGSFYPAPDMLDSAWNAIRMLRSDGYPRYSAPGQDPPFAEDSRRKLNEVNRNIIADWHAACWDRSVSEALYMRRRELVIFKICYNLLVCPVPPGIHNYNMLILAFWRINEPRLAQIVVDFFLYKSRLMPTQTTLIALLEHYRRMDDLAGFYGIIERLAGLHPRGIGLRRRLVAPVQNTEASSEGRTETPGALVPLDVVAERPRLDADVFDVLLQGLVSFNQLAHAASVFISGMQEGLTVPPRLAHRIIWGCVGRLDGPAISTLVRGFLHNFNQLIGLLLSDADPLFQNLNEALTALFDLYEAHPGAGKRAELDRHLARRLRRLRDALWVRTASQELDNMAVCLEKVEASLYPHAPSTDVDGALALLSRASAAQQRRDRNRKRLLASAKVEALYSQYVDARMADGRPLFTSIPRADQRRLQPTEPPVEPSTVVPSTEAAGKLRTGPSEVRASWDQRSISLGKLFGPWANYVDAAAYPGLGHGSPIQARKGARFVPFHDNVSIMAVEQPDTPLKKDFGKATTSFYISMMGFPLVFVLASLGGK
ncbi:hypothetical protein VTK73DRAFT_7038 [Phialemonium thermophilum]|uniref:Uncharacterized protein n=1 Tax=Phialemonium thermophilum TaxID=223376 RepID=A0ABR3XUJ8_9PEZI